MDTRTGFSLAATLLTPVLGTGYLTQAVFIAERCFRIGTMSGCDYPRTGLLGMAAIAPLQLAGPIGVVLIATGLAGAAWHAARAPAADPLALGAFVAAYSIVVGSGALVIGPVFVAPLLLLVAAVLVASGATAQLVARELLRGTVVVLGAFAAALGAIALWGARFGQLPLGGGVEWWYVGIATALGIAAGCVAATSARDPRQLLRYLVLSYGGFGLGAAAAAVALLPMLYPHGRYVNLGMTGVWRTAFTLLSADFLAGVAVLRLAGRLPWSSAVGVTSMAGLGIVVAAFATAAFAFRVAVGDVSPPVPLLPSTSTSY